ncbi:hypothetical protein HGO53_05730 [Wolbachia endosymbiont of Diaphorina citri]|jgi:hypothetical protein|uniref:hypothetical protein n=1 Tax=Wolbachia endosymbiont of Diaphorina citri TaxID=116598 RepID=UPI00155E58BB|nr:hypothetical protein [Wolbachia endosymbiont of Diaphorina citri]QJT94624.1 hypothetical protein HGO48_04420 [Wolbachia endosymbiont of Diaphorina citri]QJT94729.1 hypothetical protein HGO48_05020 [Wolbachia endosymbiont of Diaphorina citri]QJT95863.1 hypothetical protein HGO49_04420 [Wolbachia endosymbiont of Diaphorina citri]QJT95968.1 hypothetical protein HGO49_05020 [Wolbachia endosymbiont of Diaphorina citri]QJT97225.1 hypothetical protein HGO53_05130 [Wolbachia endosymbiont of Diaphor
MSYLPIVPKFLEDKNDLVTSGNLVRILKRIEKNLETFDSRIKDLESFNNVEQEFSSSTEYFGLF